MTTVRIETVVIATKEAQMRRLGVGFATAMQHNFNAPLVDQAYVELHGKWDKAREEITNGLTGVADALKLVREAFEEVDSSYAVVLLPEAGR